MTTLRERILYYAGRIRDVSLLTLFSLPGDETGQVREEDNVGAKMDSMELKREKDITVQSAVTFCNWNGKLASTGEV